MSDHAAGSGTPRFEAPAALGPGVRETARRAAGYWWLALVLGILWTIAGVVILQFNTASIKTVGILVGIMFVVASLQSVVVASITDGATRVFSWLFAVLFIAAAVICFVKPADTFSGLADVLGFLFLIVGIWWMVRAFIERPLNPAWWLGLIGGILLTIMAFWTSGQLFITKVYVLLVFAGVWALMEGIMNIVRAFEVRSLRNQI
jgi:uncharacterized membrane protein HdeD (DUF308 family)